MENDTEKMVEIARFTRAQEANNLINLLLSEGINSCKRNEIMTQVMGIIDVGGVRVEVLESDVPQTMEVMIAAGYDIPEENEQPDQIKAVTGWTSHIPILRAFSLEAQIMILFVLVAICLGLLVYFGTR
ncbi:hypothetical protein FACS189411_03160 [Bacteroidia bacterium]|nr:hypothetical protein FACS189411_03160 [Bacteroidia bacterium]